MSYGRGFKLALLALACGAAIAPGARAGIVFVDAFRNLGSTPTGDGNTLASWHQYIYEIDFSNRNAVPSDGADFPATLGFDVRTGGRFSTAAAVPEPSGLILAATGLLARAPHARARHRRM